MIRSYEKYLEAFQPRKVDSRAAEHEKRVVDSLLEFFNSDEALPADYYNKINEYLKIRLIKEQPEIREYVSMNGSNLVINEDHMLILIEPFITKTDDVEIKFDIEIVDRLGIVKKYEGSFVRVKSLNDLFDHFRKVTKFLKNNR